MENIWPQKFMVIHSKPGLAFKAKKKNTTQKPKQNKTLKKQDNQNKNSLFVKSNT